jgi:beta-N-acetylhexosaminidase
MNSCIIKLKYSVIAVFISMIISGCNSKIDQKRTDKLMPDTPISVQKKTNYTLSYFFKNDDSLRLKTEFILSNLSDEQKAGQMIICAAGELGKPETEIFKLIKEKKLGGVLMLGGSAASFKKMISDFKKATDSSGSLPLIFSIDAEPSLINIKIDGIRNFEPTNTIKTENESSDIAKQIDSVIKDIGFNQNYAPVCDFPYNKEIIGNRSFGSDENELKKLSAAFIEATQSDNIVATAKHFPGHGNVTGDTHSELVYIDGSLKELDAFKNAIDRGVICIMAGHIAVKNNEKYNTNGLPSTLSRKIITGLLKEELGFRGIVITDAMNMGALSGIDSPSLKAVLAGCDMILMPTNESKLINSIIKEMKNNPETAKQVNEFVKKIIRLKICLGLL